MNETESTIPNNPGENKFEHTEKDSNSENEESSEYNAEDYITAFNSVFDKANAKSEVGSESRFEDEVSPETSVLHPVEKELSPTEREYLNIIDKYNEIVDQLENLISRKDTLSFREDYQDRLLDLESRRHSFHLELLTLAPLIYKNEVSVRTDLLRSRGNLGEYGLPEISILKPADFQIAVEDYNQPRGPRIVEKIMSKLNSSNLNTPVPVNENEQWMYRDYSEVPKNGEIMFVYDTSELYVTSLLYSAGIMLNSPNSNVIEARGERLAQDTGLNYSVVYHADYFHSVEDFTRVHGLIVPENDIEKIAAIIRDNPEKYSTNNKYFNEQELDQIKKKFR